MIFCVYLKLFTVFLVFRVRYELGSLTGVDPAVLADAYLNAYAPATLRSYQVAYQDILQYGNSRGKHWPLWGSGEVSGFLIQGGISKISTNSIKKFGAVLSVLFGACDRASPATGPLVAKIKVGVLKTVTQPKRPPRPLWTPENFHKFVSALARPERTVFDWRIMCLQIICYFTLRRFDDVHRVKVEDIRVLDNGDIRIFQQSGKTDQLGAGSYYYIANKPFGGFTVKRILDQYVLKLGLKSTDFLFPRFSSNAGTLHVCRAAIGYGSARSELNRVLELLALPIVSLHSARASGATHGCAAGIDVSSIRDAGGWHGPSVLTYIRDERPLRRVQEALFAGLDNPSTSK